MHAILCRFCLEKECTKSNIIKKAYIRVCDYKQNMRKYILLQGTLSNNGLFLTNCSQITTTNNVYVISPNDPFFMNVH